MKPWATSTGQHPLQGAVQPGPVAVAAHQHDGGHRQPDHHPGQEAVHPGHGARREAEAPGLLVAAVRSRAGDHRAGHQARPRWPPRWRPPHGAPPAWPPRPRRGPSGSPARWCSTTASARITIDSRKWLITADGVQVDQHGDAAQHDLADHAGDEADREPGEVAPAGLPQQRAEHRQHHRHRDEPGDECGSRTPPWGGTASRRDLAVRSRTSASRGTPGPSPVRRTAAPAHDDDSTGPPPPPG